MKKVGFSALIIMFFTFGGKLLGFIKEALIASKFGSGIETDSYYVALVATGLVTSLLWIAISTTLVPLFMEKEQNEGTEAKLLYANNMMNVIFIVTVVLAVIGWFAAPYITKILAVGFNTEQKELTVSLIRIGLPKFLLTGFIGILIAFLHSRQRFAAVSSINIFSGIVIIVYILFFSNIFGIKGLMAAFTLALFAQFVVLLIASKKIDYKYQKVINLKDKQLHKFSLVILPILLGTAVNEINLVIDRSLASTLISGSVSALNYANILNNLVLGVFIATIVTIIFPKLTKEYQSENISNFKYMMGSGINYTLLISIPCAVGLFVLANPIVKAAFQRGEFDEGATSMTAFALMFYSMGLVSMSLRLLFTRIYYSLQDTKTPMVNSAIAVGLNIVLNFILIKYMAHGGLALATSIATTLATILMISGLRKKLGPLGLKKCIDCGVKSSVAAVIMGIFVYVIYGELTILFGDSNTKVLLGLTITMGVILYGVLCYLMRIKEMLFIFSKGKSILTYFRNKINSRRVS